VGAFLAEAFVELHNFFAFSGFEDAAAAEVGSAVGHPGEFLAMGDKEDRSAPPVHTPDYFHDVIEGKDVNSGVWLIEDGQPWAHGQDRRELHPFSFPAREAIVQGAVEVTFWGKAYKS